MNDDNNDDDGGRDRGVYRSDSGAHGVMGHSPRTRGRTAHPREGGAPICMLLPNFGRDRLGPNFFISMQFSGTFGQILDWHLPLWEILDLPLNYIQIDTPASLPRRVVLPQVYGNILDAPVTLLQWWIQGSATENKSKWTKGGGRPLRLPLIRHCITMTS